MITLKRMTIAAAAVASLLAFAPGSAAAATDPPGCTPDLQYDSSIPTFTQVMNANGVANNTLGGFSTGTTNRHITSQLYAYADALVTATASNPRVRVITIDAGPTTLGQFVGPNPGIAGEDGRRIRYWVIGTPAHIANLQNDATFWRGVRDGTVSESDGHDQAAAHTAFAWTTETPHGNEPAGGEASLRFLYELAARTDCANLRRLDTLDQFIRPASNPDGRDNNTRTTGWSYDPNRDLMYQTQDNARTPLDESYKYPGLYYIDAHQQTSGYFFPPNEDPVHHEISHFALDEIQDIIGPALQHRFNDQSSQYQNYNAYDLFTPEYGDSVPSLINGSAGMTYEKGSNESYGKQVYDHYLAMDETMNVVSNNITSLKDGWVSQWQEATDQGANCELQDNVLVSPLHSTIHQQPDHPICGYFLTPNNHSGDVAKMISLLQGRDVKIYSLDQPTGVTGAHLFGSNTPAETTSSTTLPAGTLWIPTAQPMKHWINATMEENPFIPFNYFYDVVDWSFPQLLDLGGNGQLEDQLPNGTAMTPVVGDPNLGQAPNSSQSVYAFNTDSLQGLGLLIDLKNQGATVYRGKTAFDAAGTHFNSGAALVDGGTISQGAVSTAAATRETPVYGLGSYPVDRYPIPTPKIGVYTGATTVPTNPLIPGAGTGQCTSTAFCEVLYALTQQAKIPTSEVIPVTSTDLAAGNLVSQAFTAFVGPNSTIAAGAGATALQAFVNAGGNFVGYGSNTATSVRNAGMTTLNTNVTNVAPWNTPGCATQGSETGGASLTSPGTSFSADFNTSNPVAWGFDLGGYIYRDSSSTSTGPVFDPTTLGTATAAVSYPNGLIAYGYTCNTLNASEFPGRPYGVDQAFGAGHNTILGSDVFFRAWNTGAVRLAMNGALYPNAAAIPAGSRSASTSGSSGSATANTPAASPTVPTLKAAKKACAKKKSKKKRHACMKKKRRGPSQATSLPVPPSGFANDPIPAGQLPPVRDAPVVVSHNPYDDVTVTVNASEEQALRDAIAEAGVPDGVEINYSSDGGKFTATLPNEWREQEERPLWQWHIIDGLIARNVDPSVHHI